MSKTSFKKHKKDFYNEEEEFKPKAKNVVDKRKEKRVDRALKTKDIDYLLHSDDDGEDPYEDEYNQEFYR
jgi:hypothetical protein